MKLAARLEALICNGAAIAAILFLLASAVVVAAASARNEATKLPACTSEDASSGPSPCLWDCKTMGNRQCGNGTPRYLVIEND